MNTEIEQNPNKALFPLIYAASAGMVPTESWDEVIRGVHPSAARGETGYARDKVLNWRARAEFGTLFLCLDCFSTSLQDSPWYSSILRSNAPQKGLL